MSNGMPLVHHARRVRANHEAGNPFSTLAGLKAHLSEMEARYKAAGKTGRPADPAR
jgi:hypothetical protein